MQRIVILSTLAVAAVALQVEIQPKEPHGQPHKEGNKQQVAASTKRGHGAQSGQQTNQGGHGQTQSSGQTKSSFIQPEMKS